MLTKLRYQLAGWLLPKDHYEGAMPSLDRAWIPTGLQPARLDISSCTRSTLQGKARYWEKNSGLLARMADLFESYTVSTGLVVSPSSSSPEFNAAAKATWEEWGREPDVGSRQPFSVLQSVIARAFFIDGESFVLLVYDVENGNAPKIQVLEAQAVRTPQGKVESATLSDGVMMNERGKPLSYHIEGAPDPVLAQFVVHVFEPSRSGQVRGLPSLHPVMNDLADLEEVQGLTKQCVKNDATLWSIIKTQTGELTPAMMRAARFGVTRPPPGTGTAGQCPSPDAGAFYQSVFGASAKVLRQGDTWESFHSDRPTANASQFARDLAEKVAAGTGFPLVLVLPQSLQGTVARGTYEMASSYFRARSLIIGNAVQSIYEFVISNSKSRVPALRDPPADWRRVTIRPPRSINVDPGRRSTAAINELRAGVTNYEILYSELGLSWQEEFDKLRDHQAYAKEIGLVIDTPAHVQEAATPDLASAPGASDETSTGDVSVDEAAAQAASDGADVAKLALNGAQLTAVQEMITQVAQRQLPAEAAKRALYIALPLTDPEDIDAMVDAAAAFTPEEDGVSA